MSVTLEGKIAIITGDSGGIGSVICERLSEEGATVVVHYSGHEEAAKQVVQHIDSRNGKAISMQADLSQSDQVAALFNRTEQQLGAPDILVNLAGVRLIGAIADMGDDAFDKMFDLNTKGAFFCMREASRRLASMPQYEITIDRDRLEALNVDFSEAMSTFGAYMGGQYVNDFIFSQRSYRVYIQADKQFRAPHWLRLHEKELR